MGGERKGEDGRKNVCLIVNMGACHAVVSTYPSLLIT